MPYRFATGNYKMNVKELTSRIKRSKLVLGDVKETVSNFFSLNKPAPIGFVAFDLDYYSSTIDALNMFCDGQHSEFFLPRLQLYYDDIVGHEISSYNDYVGELAAIRDFNKSNKEVFIAESRVFKKYRQNFAWYHQIYVTHRITHPDYCSYISGASANSLSLNQKNILSI